MCTKTTEKPIVKLYDWLYDSECTEDNDEDDWEDEIYE